MIKSYELKLSLKKINIKNKNSLTSNVVILRVEWCLGMIIKSPKLKLVLKKKKKKTFLYANHKC